MCIFGGHFGFPNFFLGEWGIQIRNQRLRDLPSTEFHPKQINFGILIHHIRSGGPSWPTGPSFALPPPIIYKIYNKVAERTNYKNVHLNLQFIDKQNLDTFIYQVIGGLVYRWRRGL